jgi:uncharacterized protein (TIGR03435 family)
MRLLLPIVATAMTCLAQSTAFEVASVKLTSPGEDQRVRRDPGRLDITNFTLKALVRYAYDIRDIQISGGPGWFDSDHWDISATAGREVTDDERKKMLQALLTERFHMTIRRESKELPVYALVVAKNGLRLKPNTEGNPERIMLEAKAGQLTMVGEGVTLPKIADVLFGQVGRRIVIDRTGITGKFDYRLEWVPDATNIPSLNGTKMEASVEGPSTFTAVQEQLGLKLESTKGPVEILVIERAEKAAGN